MEHKVGFNNTLLQNRKIHRNGKKNGYLKQS